MNHLNDTNGKYKICSDCDYWIPICVSCGGDMKVKENKANGNQFWACSHFYGKENALSCSYTKGLPAVKSPAG
jgi:hypothetical protein